MSHLYTSCLMLDVSAARQYIEHGDVNAFETFKQTNLVISTLGGQTDIVELLLVAGAKPDLANGQGDTALHRAAQLGHCDIARTLLAAGATPFLRNRMGDTPLAIAIDKSHMGMARLLIASGGVVEDERGSTTILAALRSSSLDFLRLLLSVGADMNYGPNGYTPFVFAVKFASKEIVEFLIDQGGDILTAWRHLNEEEWRFVSETRKEEMINLFRNRLEQLSFRYAKRLRRVCALSRDPKLPISYPSDVSALIGDHLWIGWP